MKTLGIIMCIVTTLIPIIIFVDVYFYVKITPDIRNMYRKYINIPGIGIYMYYKHNRDRKKCHD